MIDLDSEYLEQVRAILGAHLPECEVRVFGSRVTGHARKYSDLDLALIGAQEIDWRKMEALKDAFSASDLPVVVDLVDWHAIDESFRQLIEAEYEVLQKPGG